MRSEYMLIGLFILALFYSTPSCAMDTMTQRCFAQSVKEGDDKDGTCRKYLDAVVDLNGDLGAASQIGTTSPKCQFKIPFAVTDVERRNVVVKSLKDHPDRQNLTADRIILLAFTEAYPCAN